MLNMDYVMNIICGVAMASIIAIHGEVQSAGSRQNNSGQKRG